MALFYHPLHITDDDRVPALLKNTGYSDTFTDSGQTNTIFGSTGGLLDANTLDEKTREPVFRVELTDTAKPLALVSGDSFTASGVRLRIRSLRTTGTGAAIGVLVRTTRHAGGALNGYGLFTNGTTNYRDITLVNLSGTNTQAYGELSSQVAFTTTQADIAAVYQYLQLRVQGNNIYISSWFDGDGLTATAKTVSKTNSDHTSGGVGFMIRGAGIYDLDYMEITSDPLTAQGQPPRLAEMGGVVQEPRNTITNALPPSFNRPVRAYHRASGALVAYDTSSATDGTFRIGGLRYGQAKSVLNALDTDGDNKELGHAILGPLTPDYS